MSSTVIQNLSDSDTLLDFMIQAEDFLDNMDLYAFENWIDGTVVDGPTVSKYWIELTLMYDYDKMPDPSGAIRLINVGAKASMRTIEVQDNNLPTDPKDRINLDTLSSLSDGQAAQGTTLNQVIDADPIKRYNKNWLVDISIPRQFIDDLNDMNMDSFDSTVQDAISQEFKLDKSAPSSSTPDSDTESDSSEEEGGIDDVF